MCLLQALFLQQFQSFCIKRRIYVQMDINSLTDRLQENIFYQPYQEPIKLKEQFYTQLFTGNTANARKQ